MPPAHTASVMKTIASRWRMANAPTPEWPDAVEVPARVAHLASRGGEDADLGFLRQRIRAERHHRRAFGLASPSTSTRPPSRRPAFTIFLFRHPALNDRERALAVMIRVNRLARHGQPAGAFFGDDANVNKLAGSQPRVRRHRDAHEDRGGFGVHVRADIYHRPCAAGFVPAPAGSSACCPSFRLRIQQPAR